MRYILSVLNDREQTVYFTGDGWSSDKRSAVRIDSKRVAHDLAAELHATVDEVQDDE
jgi:hypothetical protein